MSIDTGCIDTGLTQPVSVARPNPTLRTNHLLNLERCSAKLASALIKNVAPGYRRWNKPCISLGLATTPCCKEAMFEHSVKRFTQVGRMATNLQIPPMSTIPHTGFASLVCASSQGLRCCRLPPIPLLCTNLKTYLVATVT